MELGSRTQSKLDCESDSETNAELGIYCEDGPADGLRVGLSQGCGDALCQGEESNPPPKGRVRVGVGLSLRLEVGLGLGRGIGVVIGVGRGVGLVVRFNYRLKVRLWVWPRTRSYS